MNNVVNEFNERMKELRSRNLVEMTDDEVLFYQDEGMFDEPPEWKYSKVEPPKSPDGP